MNALRGALLLLCPVLAPLSHETAALPTQCPTPSTSIFISSKTSQTKSLVLASTSATWQIPFAHFCLTSHAIVQSLYRVSSPLFVALSTGCLAPSWGLLGAVLGHLGGRLGSILGHLRAVFFLCSIWCPVPGRNVRSGTRAPKEAFLHNRQSKRQ